MKRRLFLGMLTSAVFAAGMAEARDYSDDIVRQLKRNGYKVVSVSRTLLGRTRIRATKRGGEREIILNAATGEILRDVWIVGSEGAVMLDEREEDGGNSDTGGGDDDGGDDGDDDNSGSGGGGGNDDDDKGDDNSGPGGGGGGGGGGDDDGGDDD